MKESTCLGAGRLLVKGKLLILIESRINRVGHCLAEGFWKLDVVAFMQTVKKMANSREEGGYLNNTIPTMNYLKT